MTIPDLSSFEYFTEETYSDITQILSADKIRETFFQQIKADIFISHSHNDEGLAHQLAGWLKSFGVTSFIDSAVWEYYGNIVETIAKRYNYTVKDKIRTYVDVFHVLDIELLRMIDACPYFFFIQSQNSMHTENKTLSPWLYFEVAMTRYIQKQPVSSSFSQGEESLHLLLQENYVPMSFTLDTKHLQSITGTELLGIDELIHSCNYSVSKKRIAFLEALSAL